MQSLQDVKNERIIKDALSEHAEALNNAAKASDRYARNLAYATWALVAATVILAIVEAYSIFGPK